MCAQINNGGYSDLNSVTESPCGSEAAAAASAGSLRAPSAGVEKVDAAESDTVSIYR